MHDTAELTFRDVAPAARSEPAPEVAAEVVDVASIANGKPLVRYSATEAGLNALRADLKGKTYDLTKTRDNDAARADRLRCVTLRTTLEKRRKEFKAPALAFGKLIDTEAERITNEILMLEQPIDAAIKADEQRRAAEKAERDRIEAERVAKHQASIARIRGMAARAEMPGMTAARIAGGIQALQDLVLTEHELEEFYQQAVTAKVETIAAMNALRVAAEAREAEAARVEAQRIENERVAAELAAQQAELARQAAELAAQRAESERLERLAQERREAIAAAARMPDLPTERVGEIMRGMAAAQTAQPAAQTPVSQDGVDENPDQPQPGLSHLSPGDAAVADPVAEGVATPVDATGAVNVTYPTIKIGQINARLGFEMTRSFIEDTLGVKSCGRDKNVYLFPASKFTAICDALVAHIQKVRGAQ